MEKDLTQGSPFKAIVSIGIPIILASIFQQLYTTADAIIIGKFLGAGSFAAVGLTFPVIYLLLGIILGISMGVSVIVSQYFGAKQYDKIKEVIGAAVIFLVVVTIVLSLVGWVFSEALLTLLGTPPELLLEAVTYLQAIFAGAIFMLLYNLYSSVLRGVGDVKSPFYFLLVASVLNIVLDLLFVAVFRWGVGGAAYATVISQGASSVFCFFYIKKKVPLLYLRPSEYRFKKSELLLVLQFGMPAAFQQSVMGVSMLLIQSLVNSFGAATIAGYTAATRIDAYLTMPFIGIGHALAGYAGQNIGAGKFERVKYGAVSGMKIITSISLVLLPVLWFWGGDLIRLFLDAKETDALAVGSRYLKELAPFYLVLGAGHMMLGIMRGAGDNFWTMIINIVSLTVKVAGAYWLAALVGARGLWLGTGLGWSAFLIITALRYARKGWQRKSVIAREETG